jgi:superfamily II DNA or RNA helicase
LPEIDEDYLAETVWPVGHVMAGEPIMMRDYQVDAVNRFFQNQNAIQCIATGAGKTIITGCLSKAVEPFGKSVTIVPSRDLVKQTETDYRNIGLDVGVFFGEKKQLGHTHTIATWQSLAVFDKNSKKFIAEFPIEEFLQDVICVIVDEVHSVKGLLLKELLCGSMAHIPIRWGLTGTIPKEEYEFVSLLSSIGNVVGEIKASELQDRDVLAGCQIEVLQLEEDHVAFVDWESEYKFITTDPDRMEWIGKYCQDLAETGNTLILVERRESGFILEKLIPDSIFIYGETKSKDRQKEYDEIKVVDKKIIIATYGIAAVGINIPRLFNLVLIAPGKSFVRVVQSIGRILRKAKDKSSANIYDISSSLKFARRHLSKRRDFYREANYPFTMKKVRYK